MPSSELVSVVVPAFNHAAYVGECLRVLEAQTYRPLELLIADDASTDGTAEAIEAFLAGHADTFERVVFQRHTVNIGAAATLNGLLAQARGRYVFLNASDDRAEPDAVTTLVGVLQADPRAAMAVGDSTIIDDTGQRVYWGPHRERVPEESATIRMWVQYLARRQPARGVRSRACSGASEPSIG